MPRISIPLQSAENANPQANRERLVNLYAEKVPASGKSKVVLHGTPGYSSFSTPGKVTGLYNANGVLYAATDSALYLVNSDGAYSSATSSGSFGPERTSIAWNGTDFYVQPGE